MSAEQSSQDRQIRVFVSSTFRDMQRERELLVKHVFPELRRVCARRFVSFIEVDLRWGITEEQAAEGRVLPICLEEIRLSRPFFIGLLGERYGWIPLSVPAPVLAREPWLQEHVGRRTSITELEVMHGVLNDPSMAGHAAFYFRDPDYPTALTEDERREMVETDIPEEIQTLGEAEAQRRTAERRVRLAALKRRIRDSSFPVLENYADPEALAAAVRDRFVTLIDRLYPESAAPDPLDRESLDHESYAAHKLAACVPRPAQLAALDRYAADGTTGLGLVVTGESGGGKTVLLADWVRAWRPGHPGAHVLAHYFGATSDSASVPRCLYRLLQEVKCRFDLPDEIPVQPDLLGPTFQQWILKTPPDRPLVFVLDAINQIDGDESDRALDWLPRRLPPHVRVIVSALPGAALDALRERGWAEHALAPPDADERGRMIDRYLGLYRKSLKEELRSAIAGAPGSANPLFLRTLLEELRQFGSFEQLPARMAEYLAARTPEALFRMVLGRWRQDFDAGTDLVRRALRFLGAARQGLNETEWRDLLGDKAGPLPRQTWSPLFLAMEPHLTLHSSLYAFGHDFLRQAVRAEFMGDEGDRREAHQAIADYFETQWTLSAGPHACSELPFQRICAADWTGVERTLCDPQFVEAKCSFGLARRLLEDYDFAREALKRASVDGARLGAFHEAFRSEYHIVSAQPERSFQQLRDRLQWAGRDDPIIDGILSRARQAQRGKGRRWIQNDFKRSGSEMTLAGPDSEVSSCVVLPRRRVLAAGYADGTLRLWDLTYGNCRAVIGIGGEVRQLAACGENTIIAQCWNGRILVVPATAVSSSMAGAAPEDPAVSVSRGHDGRVLAAYRSGRLVALEESGGHVLEETREGRPGQEAAVSLGPGEDLIAVENSIIKMRQGVETARYEGAERFRTMSISPGGRWVAAETVAGLECFDAGPSQAPGKMKPGAILPRYGRAIGNIPIRGGLGLRASDYRWISDRSILWVNYRVHLYDPQTGLRQATVQPFGYWDAQCGCPLDARTAAIGRRNGRIEICRLPLTEPLETHSVGNSPVVAAFPGGSPGEITAVLADGRVVVQGGRGQGEAAAIPALCGTPVSAAPGTRPYSIVVGTSRGHVFDVDSGQSGSATPLYSHRSEILHVQFSPDGRLLATSSRDRRIIIFQPDSRTVQTIMARHRRRVTGLAWHSNSRHIFSTSTDRTLRTWDAIKGHELVTCRSKRSRLASLALDPFDHELAGCDYEGPIRKFSVQSIWDFLHCRSRERNGEWGIRGGNSEQAYEQAERLPLDDPPLPGISLENGVSQCEYAAPGVLAYSWNSGPVILLDVENNDVAASFTDAARLAPGENFTSRFTIDRSAEVVLRGTSAGRVFIWELPEEFAERSHALRGPLKPWHNPAWEGDADGRVLTTCWANGAVTILETGPSPTVHTLAVDTIPLAGAGVAASGSARVLVAARSTSHHTMREMLFAGAVDRIHSLLGVEDPKPEYVGGHRSRIVHLRASPNSVDFLIVQEDGFCSLWSAVRRCRSADLGRLNSAKMNEGAVSAFTEDGRWLAVLTAEGQMALWDTRDSSRLTKHVDSYRGDKRSRTEMAPLIQEELSIDHPFGLLIVADGEDLSVVALDRKGSAVTVDGHGRNRPLEWSTSLSRIEHVSEYSSEADTLIAGDGSGLLAAIRLKRRMSDTFMAPGVSSIRASSIVRIDPLTIAVACQDNQVQFREWAGWREVGTYWTQAPVACLRSARAVQGCAGIDADGNLLFLRLCD